MIGRTGLWILLLILSLPPAGYAEAPSLWLETWSGPAAAGEGETRLHVIVPPGAALSPGDVHLLAMVFRGEEAVASSRWEARLEPGTDCRPPLGETRVFGLPPGSYRARVRAEPSEGDAVEREISFRVPDTDGNDLRLSELVVGCCPEGESLPDTLIPRGAVPFGEGTRPCVYFRVADRRPDLPDTAYVVRARIRSQSGEAYPETWTLPRRNGLADTIWVPGTLPAGSYKVEVEVRAGPLHEARTASFTVVRETAGREPWALRILLGYVATPEETVELDEAPDDSLDALWRRFWERRDPLPETPTNEALLRFEGRVEEATRRFGVMEPGWQSDQGRVFIRLGEPDRVETIHADTFRPAGEIWYYYDRHATYVFQDVDGFGSLRLVGGR